jgi:hypothetical protein
VSVKRIVTHQLPFVMQIFERLWAVIRSNQNYCRRQSIWNLLSDKLTELYMLRLIWIRYSRMNNKCHTQLYPFISKNLRGSNSLSTMTMCRSHYYLPIDNMTPNSMNLFLIIRCPKQCWDFFLLGIFHRM